MISGTLEPDSVVGSSSHCVCEAHSSEEVVTVVFRFDEVVTNIADG